MAMGEFAQHRSHLLGGVDQALPVWALVEPDQDLADGAILSIGGASGARRVDTVLSVPRSLAASSATA